MENSRFKFRVWDKLEQKYISENVSVTTRLNRDGLLFVDGSTKAHIDNFVIVEFCTGLKDKNGNLIYEGDIIRFCVKRRGFILTYERIVVWDKDKCGFVIRNAKDQAAPLAKWNMPHPDTHIIEVVGNIHKQAE